MCSSDFENIKRQLIEAEVELNCSKANIQSYKHGDCDVLSAQKLQEGCDSLVRAVKALEEESTNLFERVIDQKEIVLCSRVDLCNIVSYASFLEEELTSEDYIRQMSRVLSGAEVLLREAEDLAAPANHVETFDCVICQDEHPIDDVFCISTCMHKLCLGCARRVVHEDLKYGDPSRG